MAHNSVSVRGISLLLWAFCLVQGAQTGEVSGVVLGSSGLPVEGARVYAISTESPNPGRHFEVLTDSNGEFRLSNVREGQNEIHAYAPQLGYPDNLFAVFQTAPVPTVTVKPGVAIHGLVIQFGKKPGTLAGAIVDRKTGKPLATASVTLRWVDRPDYYVRSSVDQNGRFSFVIPSRAIRVQVECSGYQTWNSTITVPSGEALSLDISMSR